MTPLETLQTFDETSLPDLDTVVLGTLAFLERATLPPFPALSYTRPLIVGSGNAAVTGKILFSDIPAVFADESTYEAALTRDAAIDAVIVISASGSKHAITIAEKAKEQQLPTHLITNNEHAPAAEVLEPTHVHVFPKIREPYTYNTSTYMSMIASRFGEDPARIRAVIEEHIAPVCDAADFSKYDAFFFVVPEAFDDLRELFTTKFDELFGAQISGRVFTTKQTMHAKTVVPSEKECFVYLGVDDRSFGASEQQCAVPIPENATALTVMAIGYYFIGRLQRSLPPYFKNSIDTYVKEASELFGKELNVIVE